MRNIKIVKLLLFFGSIGLSVLSTSCSSKLDRVSRSINEFYSLELGTVEYLVSKSVDASKEIDYKEFKVSPGDKKILYSVKATIKAGLDLTNFDPKSSIIIKGKTIFVSLPKPVVLSVNIGPYDIHYEYSVVSWFRKDFSEKEDLIVRQMGEQSIRDAAESIGILTEAETNAKDYFEALLANMGYKHIIVDTSVQRKFC